MRLKRGNDHSVLMEDKMTEEQIEIRIEKAFDRLDARLMSGELTQEEYDELARDIRIGADNMMVASRHSGN
jgi:hypothetical protein